MTPEIRQLDERTRDRIAAGEVVERPASVVKELLENALDADADRIDVSVEAGGTGRIVVRDDGVGMSETDVKAAVREHTTSKLRTIDELEAIGTLGFRGEALHAIGAVSRLAIRTRPRGESRGTELIVEDGDVVDCRPVGVPEGTTVEVTDLFGNVPARRKYLKADATELSHVQGIASGYALSAPDVAVSLTHDDRELFATPGDGDRRSAVMAVYGREVASAMIPVEGAGDGPLAGVSGLVSDPETNRAGREYMTTLVNGRYVTTSAVREAVVDAYGTQLAPDRYPFAVIDLDVPAGGVDVNVHPRKLEVLFADEAGVREQVRETVEGALLEAGLLRSRAPRGRSAAEQTEIEPERSGEPSVAETDAPIEHTGVSSGTDSSSESTSETGSTSTSREPTERTDPATTPSKASTRDLDDKPSRRPTDDPDRKFREPTSQRTLDGEPATDRESFERLPSMKLLGQYGDTYLIAETDDGLVLVDQHAADERVNYERLRDAFDGDVTTQTLADPVSVPLTSREAALARTGQSALARLGFHVREADGNLLVTTVPSLLAETLGDDAPALARDLVGELADGTPESTVEAVADDLLGDLACHPSIKGNTSLTEGRVTALLAALDDCENPYACPHGRPTIVEFSEEEIAERFERDYPGHGGRRR